MPNPLEINVEKIPWKIRFRVVYSLWGIASINLIHAAEWFCTEALFRESGKLLNNSLKMKMIFGA